MSVLSPPATWRTLGSDHGWGVDEVEPWIVETCVALATEPPAVA